MQSYFTFIFRLHTYIAILKHTIYSKRTTSKRQFASSCTERYFFYILRLKTWTDWSQRNVYCSCLKVILEFFVKRSVFLQNTSMQLHYKLPQDQLGGHCRRRRKTKAPRSRRGETQEEWQSCKLPDFSRAHSQTVGSVLKYFDIKIVTKIVSNMRFNNTYGPQVSQ